MSIVLLGLPVVPAVNATVTLQIDDKGWIAMETLPYL
jgi:hypothetical protein